MRALSATNEQDFQEKVREFNIGQQNWLQQFNAQYGGLLPNGQQTLQAQQQAFNQAIARANVTGIYGGSQALASTYTPGQVIRNSDTGAFGVIGQNGSVITSGPGFDQAVAAAAQKPGGILSVSNADFISGANAMPTEQAREFNVNTQKDLAQLASSLQGPADYFRYLNATNAGRSIIGNLYTGNAQPAGGAPVGQTAPQTLNNILGNLGLGPQAAGGGGSGGSSGGAINTNTGSGVALPYGLGQLPYMNQIQPTAYNSMSNSAKQFIGGAYAAAGYDPSDIQRSILSETPATGAAPSSSTANYASPNSQSLFG